MFAEKEFDNVSSSEDEFSPAKAHPPISPASGFESLFLDGLLTSNISANALAETLRKTAYSRSNVSSSGLSVTTDDFATAVESPDDFSDDEYLFSKDAILQSRDSIPELEDDSEEEEEHRETLSRNLNMASTKPSIKTAAKPVADGEKKVDVASHVYEGAKGAWAWGKGLPVVSIFMGVTEAVAGKVVSIVGTDLEEIDHHIKPHLLNLDNGVLNPAIAAIVGVLLGAAGKTEETVKPIIMMLLKPFSLIKNTPEKKESEDPELTSMRPATRVTVSAK